MANPNLARANGLEQAAVEVTIDDAGKSHIQRSAPQNDLPRSENDDSDPSDKWMERNRAVQKRIGRMQRNFDQKLADREAAHQREVADLRKEFRGLTASRGDQVSTTDAEHESAQAKLQAELVAANEAGDSAEAARLTRLMTAKENEHWHKKTLAALHTGEGEGAEGKQGKERETPAGNGTRPAPSAGKDWITANEDWWEDEEFLVERAAANAIHNQLRADGSDDSDPKHYQRVAKRLAKKFPALAIQKVAGKFEDDEDDEDEEPKPRNRDLETNGGRGPSTNFGDRGGGNGGGNVRGRMTLSAAQVANMRSVNMDPDNDAHVLAYAREANLLAASGEG